MVVSIRLMDCAGHIDLCGMSVDKTIIKGRKEEKMFCKNCGKQIPDEAVVCPYCGQSLAAASTSAAAPVVVIKSYLTEAILTTACCCIPFGVVSIVYAAQVSSLLASGNIQAAQAASENARKWATIALIVGLVAYGLSVLIRIFVWTLAGA